MNSTPPSNHLYLAFCFSTCFLMLRMTAWSDSSRPTEEDLTTKAFGTSPERSSGIWMTEQSWTAGWSSRQASSSAGATWWPCDRGVSSDGGDSCAEKGGKLTLTLISSLIRSTTQICSFPFSLTLNSHSSPVRMNLPSLKSTNVSFVAFSFFRYPSTTLGDFTHSSPGWSWPEISLPSGSISFAS